MDYDYVDETRPRFQVQSVHYKAKESGSEIDRNQAAACSAIALLLLSYGWTLTALPHFFLMWLALSILVGPFAPLSLTGGDCRVGIGELLEFKAEEYVSEAEKQKRSIRQPSYMKKVDVAQLERGCAESRDVDSGDVWRKGVQRKDGKVGEWKVADMEFLRKQMTKHPRGKLRRWELIAEAFDGKYTVENVVSMAKGLEQRKPSEDDDFSKFLAQRKNSDRSISSSMSLRCESEDVNVLPHLNGSQAKEEKGNSQNDPVAQKVEGKVDWTESDDKALLKGLKVFPKETFSRWDRVAAAVPGRTKPQCFKRFAELREKFRNAKANRKESNPMAELE